MFAMSRKVFIPPVVLLSVVEEYLPTAVGEWRTLGSMIAFVKRRKEFLSLREKGL